MNKPTSGWVVLTRKLTSLRSEPIQDQKLARRAVVHSPHVGAHSVAAMLQFMPGSLRAPETQLDMKSIAVLATVFTLLGLTPAIAATKPLKVFVLAGQSNMEGQGVVDLGGKDYNDGKGTLAALLRDPAKAPIFKHLRDAQGKWTVRDDVWVRYQREQAPLLRGPLGLGFSVYGDSHHFGPELQFGHVLGDHFENQVLLIKTAWGGKSLFHDFRPPSSGGEVGKYYTLMIAQVREALANLKTDFPGYNGTGYDLAGFVWYQGWNDGVSPQTGVAQYETNLVNLIRDVRKEFNVPKLPVVIGELTGPWLEAPPEWTKLRQAQAAAAARSEFAGNVLFVATRDFVRKPEDSPNPGHGHHEFGNAETYFLVGDALGKGMLSLLGGKTRLAFRRTPSMAGDNRCDPVMVKAAEFTNARILEARTR